MKRTLILIMALLLIAALSACGNVGLGAGNYKFEKVHVDTHNYHGCLTVEKWYENKNGTGFEVKTKEVGAIYLSEGTYFLIEKECPFCAHPTEKGGEAE